MFFNTLDGKIILDCQIFSSYVNDGIFRHQEKQKIPADSGSSDVFFYQYVTDQNTLTIGLSQQLSRIAECGGWKQGKDVD